MYNSGFKGRGQSSRGGSSRGSRGYNRFAGRNNRGKPRIDVNKFINKAQVLTLLEEQIDNKFSDFNLHPELFNNILKKGFDKPMPIQDKSIKHIMEGKDLIGIANTGMGKTAAFLIPLIQKVIKNPYEKVIIIAPTRELAEQIEKELRALTFGLRMYSVLAIGGVGIYQQIKDLRMKFNFLIGTPGRIKDLSERRVINYSQFSNIVLDEVDRMFDMGFSKEILALLDKLPKQRQSLFFSATITRQVETLINENSINPITVTVKVRDTAVHVEQDIVRVQAPTTKIETLHEILIKEEMTKTLIFGRTKHAVGRLAEELRDRGFRAESIHGDKTQYQRQRALASFKNNAVNILVATDVAARGLDIPNVSHVINYELPDTYEDYIHRIGRTGRANKSGKALTFVN
jgi:superfamily II DNA/RNA helicase